jgi:hypothetical protein
LIWIASLCCIAGHAEDPSPDVAAQPRIQTASELENYLATTPAGESPLDRLSAPAKSRFLTSFVAGHPSTADLTAELTREEAIAVLALFGYEAFVPPHLRATHLSIGATETAAATSPFAEFDRALFGADPRAAAHAIYSSRFEGQQTASELKSLSDGDVALHFRAANSLEQLDPEAQGEQHLLLDLAELERRGVVAPGWIEDTFRILIANRDFEGARVFRSRHEDVNLLPVPEVREEITNEKGPTVLAVSADGSLIHRTVDINHGPRIVVVAGCHFSKDAAREIESNPELRDVFSRHSFWVTPAQGDPADPELPQWNREHPGAEMSTAYRQSEWRGFDTWQIPTFYFLQDGHIVAKVIGWQNQEDAVRTGLKTIGLMP